MDNCYLCDQPKEEGELAYEKIGVCYGCMGEFVEQLSSKSLAQYMREHAILLDAVRHYAYAACDESEVAREALKRVVVPKGS